MQHSASDLELNYSDPRYHLTTRKEITEQSFSGLFRVDREGWPLVPEFIMWPSRLQRLHASILDASDNLIDGLQNTLDQPERSLQEVLGLTGMRKLGLDLIEHVEIHHRTEDKHVLPNFLQRFPNLRRAISLIENDHQFLDNAMDVARIVFGALAQPAVDKSHVASALASASSLDRLLKRHTHDEENILIPATMSGE